VEEDMAEKMLIVHGYSDGSTSFTGLGDFFVANRMYGKDDIFYVDYSSMADAATFEDFADKLDELYDNSLNENKDAKDPTKNTRIDVACHSTGSLVVRAWLALHAERSRRRGLDPAPPCPVERLLCFAPANFGSDLAGLGESFLGKFRSTFFNRNSTDFMESGKVVLQGLEPASPFQWRLSEIDLHGGSTYFSPKRKPEHQCFPFVFAAGEAYDGVQAKLIKQRGKLGTDGTVRIAGTSLNTRGVSLDFRSAGPALVWWERYKYDQIPFAVFAGFNHGSIIDPKQPGFAEPNGPGWMALEVLKGVKDLSSYKTFAGRFDEAAAANARKLPPDRQVPYQQFFFRVRDDVDVTVDDFFIDFYVVNRKDGSVNQELTLFFDEHFAKEVTRHSTTGSHRVFLMECGQLRNFKQRLEADDAVLMLEISGKSPLPQVRYEKGTYEAWDWKRVLEPDEPYLLFPNTTTLIDVVLNRRESDTLLGLKDAGLHPIQGPALPPPDQVTGRGAIVMHNIGQNRGTVAVR
jgi:pimeloyl-ACP methyl ester carboxylesterase